MVGFSHLALLLGSLLPAYGFPATSRRAAPAVVPGSYIVTLKQGLVEPQVASHLSWVSEVHARSLARRQTSGVNKVWSNSFKGYSGEFDEATVEEILSSDEVSHDRAPTDGPRCHHCPQHCETFKPTPLTRPRRSPPLNP